ncbi:MAG: homocysteine S-methyltransferase family protein, partial [Nitrospirota bacterium]
MIEKLDELLNNRILVLDGAMGTMIQNHKLNEADFRGTRYADHVCDVKGNNDLLVLTQPKIIEDIHVQYLQAGADIIETNTFNSNAISMADYQMETLAHELNVAGAQVAKRAAARVEAEQPGRQCFVAGALGPTNRTASMSPDVNNPAFRAVTFDDLSQAYYDQVRGLVEGGIDLLMVETIFDTLNAKAAFYAIAQYCEEIHRDIPIMASVTITDLSGRTLSGQLIEAFWNSISHAHLLSVGINCALGAKQMRPYIEELSNVAPIYISCYPNAGLPNAFGGFDETPERMGADLRDFATQGWVNIVGGCCGSTPDHIRAIAEGVKDCAPHKKTHIPRMTRLSGFEPLTIRPEANFVNIGERTNVTGSPKFSKLILNGDLEEALAV